MLDLLIVSVFTLALAPQSALEIGHPFPPITDRDAPTHPSVFSVSPADDEGVLCLLFGAYRS